MPDYILIDNDTGYIRSDLRNIDGKAYIGADITPIKAACITDESLGKFGREYAEYGPNCDWPSNRGAYHVYRVDVGGSEVVPVVTDRRDRDTIDEVERVCEKVAVVTWRTMDDV